MFLFFVSFLFVFASSYLMSSIIAPKKSVLGLIYTFVIAFAQLVLTFEILSLFSAISQIGVLAFNILFFTASFFIWGKYGKILWNVDFAGFKNRVNNSLKLDKSLMVLYVAYCVMIIGAIVLCLIMPITNTDANAYHVARSLFWVFNGNLNHFETADVRNLCLPINSEILYSWILLFIKKPAFLGFFSFVGYLLSIISLYNILGYLGYCVRKRLWVIFILSSFASVLVQISGTETDIIIAGLVFSSLFLYWTALKSDTKAPLFMSALAYALAIGIKTPSIIAIPGMAFLFLFLSIYFKRKDFYKPLMSFLVFGVINFFIFSSYNYVLNYIHFGNFMGAESFMQVSKNFYGIKGAFANFIKYIFMSFDFTGFRWGDYLSSPLLKLRTGILSNLGLGYVNDGLYSINTINRSLLEPLMGAGVLGLLVWVPCLVWSVIKPVFSWKSKKTWFIFVFAIVFVINIFAISYLLAYMLFSVRFIMFFMVISSPILVYSYWSNKNPLKYIVILFSIFYLVFVSTNLWARPISKIFLHLKRNPSITYLREIAACKDYTASPEYLSVGCLLKHTIKNKYSNKNNILFFMGASEDLFDIKALEFDGYNVDFRLMEDADNIDFNKYNIVITGNKGQKSTYIKYFDNRKNELEMKGNGIFVSNRGSVICVYEPNEKAPAPAENSFNPPYHVFCGFSKQFIQDKNLKKIDKAEIPDKHNKDFDYYILYGNQNLPPMMNSK